MASQIISEENEAPPSAQRPPWVPAAGGSRKSTTWGPLAPQRNHTQTSRLKPICVATDADAHSTVTHTSTARAPAVDRSSSQQVTHHDHIPSRSENPSPASDGVTGRSRSCLRPPAAALPTRTFFDPWNSSSTGHQHAEKRISGSTSWRHSRNLKLAEQYKGGLSGGDKRIVDTVGAGSEGFGKDGRETDGQRSLTEFWSSSSRTATTSQQACHEAELARENEEALEDGNYPTKGSENGAGEGAQAMATPAAKQIFSGLCFYINGSTAPLVSDHKLRLLLSMHGANHSIALERRTVTHVIVGTMSGGGLAASKKHKEITRTRCRALRFVSPSWYVEGTNRVRSCFWRKKVLESGLPGGLLTKCRVLDSIQAGKRLSESRYSPLELAPSGQGSVLSMQRLAAPPAG